MRSPFPESASESPPLSPATETLLSQIFRFEDQTAARAILLEYGSRSGNKGVRRIRLNCLHACHADLTRLRKLVNTALADYREGFMLEYELVDGRLHKSAWSIELHSLPD